MRTCEEYGEMISAMIDGELSADDSEVLGEHLLTCASCRVTIDAFMSMSECLDAESPPRGFADGVMSQILGDKQKKSKAKGSVVYLKWAAAVAACFILLYFSASSLNLINFSGNIDSAVPSDQARTYTERDDGTQAKIEAEAEAETEAGLEAEIETETEPEAEIEDEPLDGDTDVMSGGSGAAVSPRSAGVTGRAATFDLPAAAPVPQATSEPLRGISDLHDMESAQVFSGTSEETLVAEITDADTLKLMADLLRWKEYPKSDFELGEPVYTINAHIAGGGTYVLRIWSKDNLLYCAVDDSGVLFMAAGELTRLNEALGLTFAS